MDYQQEQAVAMLSRTPATLAALLRGLPDAWTQATEGPATWSAYDIVGHLLHGEEGDWLTRARIILEHGEERPFDAFNRTAMFDKYQGYSLDQLLTAFEQARAQNLAALRELDITPEKLALTGTHPALGRVTLSQLLASWVTHDLNHIGQIVEVLAHQYGDAVGPWRAYLAILTRPILTE
ncbi:MAG TPA: DinB family protein [Ktedonobacterales bacterium]|nr:DinB family protein [Ktedonobacterales bacterium]HEX5572353.1 DinB family protein [Ktedonobacterales bacterium]